MFCNKCRNELSDDAKFCTKCGFKVENIKSIDTVFRKEYEFNSFDKDGRTKLVIDGAKIIISRPGAFAKLSHGFTGEKTILIKDISAVQFKPAGMTAGYLQFIFPGSIEQKSGAINGAINENIIYFSSGFNNKEVNARAKEIKEYIENYNLNTNQNNNVINIHNSSDKYDKLTKIKKLLDDGVLTQEEFETEKKKILN